MEKRLLGVLREVTKVNEVRTWMDRWAAVSDPTAVPA